MIPNKILIVRTDRIGDVVLTLPLAAALKHYFPQAHITFGVRSYTAPITQNCMYVDETLILPDDLQKAPVSQTLSLLKGKKFDTVFAVSPSYPLALLLLLAGIKHRVGIGYRWYSFLFNHKIWEHRSKVHFHELEYNLRMLKGIQQEIPYNRQDTPFGLNLSPEITKKADALIQGLNIAKNKPLIVIHPGSGGSAMDLPVERFHELVLELEKSHAGTILVTGMASEKAICEAVASKTSAINLAGNFTLSELLGIIEKSDIFVSNSTGPLHIATALHKYVVGFYPKIKVCSAKRWGPYSEKSIVFEPPINCKNCTRKKCAKRNCMDTIDIKQVAAKIKDFSSTISNHGENNAS